jgi:hypothetical protein
MQEVFIELSAKNLAAVERAIKTIEETGGRVLHVYPPSIMIASVPPSAIAKLSGKAGIVKAETGPFGAQALKKAPHDISFAYSLWNEHVSVDRRMRAMASPDLGRSWGATQRLPPDPPAAILEKLRQREHEMAPMRAAPKKAIPGSPNYSIPVLVGRIGVGLVVVDSTVSAYAVTNDEKVKVFAETTEGLNMLTGFEPRANIQWFYDIRRPKISLTAGQFPTTDGEDIWRNAAMKAMGYSADLAGMNKYIADIKTKLNTNWAYAIFVTKYPKVWFAYYWGNHVVMDFTVDGWGINNFNLVVAHETGHVFGCGDEYSGSGCNCTSQFGRYKVVNGNCETCAAPFVQCLMAHNTAAVCDYSRGQLGWNELAVQSEGATTLKGTWTFDFDTGIQGPPTGADIWWEQVNNVIRWLVPQSGATIAHMGKPNFDAVSYQTLKAQSYTATPINGSNNSSNKLTPGSVIAIKTSAGRYAKMRINSYGYNLGITWVTYK